MKIYCNNLLPNDRTHATPADIGPTIKPTPTTDKNTDVVFAPMKITLSIVSHKEVGVL